MFLMKYLVVIKIKESAKKDLKEIYEYIRKDSEYYATKTMKDIKERIYNLRFFPYIGRKNSRNKSRKLFRNNIQKV